MPAQVALHPLFQRTRAVVQQQGWQAEWIFVDDASADGAWEVLKHLSATDDRIHGLRLDRNRGQHYAIYIGLKHARGQFTVVMDCDLEDPPEEIPETPGSAGARRVPTSSSPAIPIALIPLGAAGAAGSIFGCWRRRGRTTRRLSMFSVLSEKARSAYVGAPLARSKLPSALAPTRTADSVPGKPQGAAPRGCLVLQCSQALPACRPQRATLQSAAPRFGARDTCVRRALSSRCGLSGAWPTVPIWLAAVMSAVIALALWRSSLTRGGALPPCEMERLSLMSVPLLIQALVP